MEGGTSLKWLGGHGHVLCDTHTRRHSGTHILKEKGAPLAFRFLRAPAFDAHQQGPKRITTFEAQMDRSDRLWARHLGSDEDPPSEDKQLIMVELVEEEYQHRNEGEARHEEDGGQKAHQVHTSRS